MAFSLHLLSNMGKRRRKGQSEIKLPVFNDIKFPRNCPGADYDSSWNDTSCDINFRVCLCWESAVIFAAREGWISTAQTSYDGYEEHISCKMLCDFIFKAHTHPCMLSMPNPPTMVLVHPLFDFSKFHTKNFCLPTRKPSTMVYGHPLLKFWEFSSKNTLSGRIP